MVDTCSKQSGLIIFSSIKYACTSAKYKLALSNEKKVVPDHVLQIKNGGDIPSVS